MFRKKLFTLRQSMISKNTLIFNCSMTIATSPIKYSSSTFLSHTSSKQFSYCVNMNLLSSSLLSKTFNIKVYRTIILRVVLYGCETWSLTMREERRLRVFENRVLRRVFGPKRDEVTGNGENYIRRSLGIFTPYPILCGW